MPFYKIKVHSEFHGYYEGIDQKKLKGHPSEWGKRVAHGISDKWLVSEINKELKLNTQKNK